MSRTCWKSMFLLPLCLLLLVAGCGGSSGNYSLTATTASLSLTAGSTGTFSVTSTATNGFNQPVAVALTGLPAGVTASPSTLTLTAGAAQTVTLTAASSAAVANGTVTLTGTAGSLTHTATVALSLAAAPPPPPPAPSFTLSVSPTSQMLMAGQAQGHQVTLLATAVGGFTGTVTVTAASLPTGITIAPTSLSLVPGTSQSLSIVAGSNAAIGNSTVTFNGTSGTLTSTATVSLVVSSPTMTSATGPDVTTYHFDNTRQGLNAQETMLTPQNVNSTSFGLMGNYMVDGKVDAQPLYVGGLSLQTGTETHKDNVVYVATENDSVYALNAATGAQEWKTSVIGAGETVSDAPYNCNQILPTIGITATPVIDRSYGPNGAIFVLGATKDATGNYHYRLHALDLTIGNELPGSPVEIKATSPGTGIESQAGQITFDPHQQVSRVSMLLVNGTIYTAWGSHCDVAQ